MQNLKDLLEAVAGIALRAGDEILEVYRSSAELQVDYKADASPLTAADLRANALILRELAVLTPDIPVLSEESELPPFAVRRGWQDYWLIDPLDGTQEFLSRNGEFTVNVALVRAGVPVLGVVHAPVLALSWMGIPGTGAWKCETGEPWQAIHSAALTASSLRVVASRRHGAEALEAMLARLGRHFPDVVLVNRGSSLKFCLLAQGSADFYPRLAPTSEWDTAAAQAVLVASGGAVLGENLQALRYNTRDDLRNPSFLAVADAGADWARLLA